jgi:hypothetical protein
MTMDPLDRKRLIEELELEVRHIDKALAAIREAWDRDDLDAAIQVARSLRWPHASRLLH